MNKDNMLAYLAALEENNNREWYHANKADGKTAAQEFEELILQLIFKIREFDSSIPPYDPKELTFKLMRDTRFSHDKSPYNPAFRAHIGPCGKLPVPVGYYIMVKPGNRSFLGGGLFADMFKDATAMVRDYISLHGREWEEIISAPAFTELFTLGNTSLKKVPQGFDPSHPQAEYLKWKCWYLECPIPDIRLTGPDFAEYAADIFAKMKPFNDYLNRALQNFQMPSR
ncbi:DUF2461 domain-containing protein [Anaerolentibacter hominis]|uniref:DUF2461 domain-containing protein n=1 Tax=Anaerolentibacter hominis TaxID=3079009 RepID=UPI0031B82B1A